MKQEKKKKKERKKTDNNAITAQILIQLPKTKNNEE